VPTSRPSRPLAGLARLRAKLLAARNTAGIAVLSSLPARMPATAGDGNSRVRQVLDDNGKRTNYEYDSLNRQTKMIYRQRRLFLVGPAA